MAEDRFAKVALGPLFEEAPNPEDEVSARIQAMITTLDAVLEST